MDQYLLIPFLVGWTSIYQLFWCSPGVPGFWPIPKWLCSTVALLNDASLWKCPNGFVGRRGMLDTNQLNPMNMARQDKSGSASDLRSPATMGTTVATTAMEAVDASCSHKMMVTESIESLVQAEKGRRAKAKVAPRLHFEADPNWSWWNIRWKIHEKTIKKIIWIQHFCWLNHGKPIYIHFWSLLCAVVWPHCSPFIRVSYGQHWDSPRSLVAAMKVGTNPKSWIQYSTLSPFW